MPVVSVLATSNPATADLPLYDDDDVLIWRSDNLGTGASGSVWLPDLPVASGGTGTVTVTLTPPQGTKVETTVPLEDQAITFVTVEL